MSNNINVPKDKLSNMDGASPTKQRARLVVILFVILLFSYVDRINISILLADNAFLTDLGIKGDPVAMGMLMTAFMIAYAASNILFSPMSDYFGPRKALLIAFPIWAVSMSIGGLATGLSMMLMARVLLGVGEGMHYPVQMKYVKNWFPPIERGKANSVWQFGLFIGPALAMPILTWLIGSFGWRGSFFVLAALTVIPFMLVWRYAADTPRDSRYVNAGELEHIEAGLRVEREREMALEKASFAESLKFFIYNYRYWIMVFCFMFNAASMFGIYTWLPSYLKAARGFSWAAMGALSSLPYVAGAVGLIICGYLGDKTGKRAVFCVIGNATMALGIYMAAMVENNMASAFCLALAIFGAGLTLPSIWSISQNIVPTKALGAGVGLMNGIGSIGGALSPVIVGYIIKTSGSYVGGLMCLVACAAMASVLALGLVKEKF